MAFNATDTYNKGYSDGQAQVQNNGKRIDYTSSFTVAKNSSNTITVSGLNSVLCAAVRGTQSSGHVWIFVAGLSNPILYTAGTNQYNINGCSGTGLSWSVSGNQVTFTTSNYAYTNTQIMFFGT